jgi:hemerythrin-like domain-containing protein
MAEAPKPIKRSAELAPLSREHHEGLLAVWKIRQGHAKGIALGRIAAFVQWFWNEHLQVHFQKEEAALPSVLPQHPFIQQMFQEHAQIKNLVDDVAPYGDLKKFEVLAQTLNDHIRFEERQLFAEVEKAASPDQLRILSEKLQDEKNTAVWEDAFWIHAR